MIDLSKEEDKNLRPSFEKETPFTADLCSYRLIKVFLSLKSQRRIYPSWAPEIILLTKSGHFAITLTPSEWPWRAAKKGFANILWSLVALVALWNSLALEKGCYALGERVTEVKGCCVIVAILTISLLIIRSLEFWYW